jgi:hypothetical protein
LLNEEQFAGGIPQKINDRIAAKARALNIPVLIAAPRQAGSPTQTGKFPKLLPLLLKHNLHVELDLERSEQHCISKFIANKLCDQNELYMLNAEVFKIRGAIGD